MNSPKDFTLTTFTNLLQSLREQSYQFRTFSEFLKNPAPKACLLRHDIDLKKRQAVVFAELEAEVGIKATYYFRAVKYIFHPAIIRRVVALGYEIGYHYEDLSLANGDLEEAIPLFEKHLKMFRQHYPVETICMHGSPMSKWDNRSLWDKYDYGDYGIIGELYFDVDFTTVLYLTGTGRRWDGESVAIRDKVKREKSKGKNNFSHLRFHSTKDIIKAAEEGSLADKMMIITHPQRWHDRPLPWVKELVWQNVKNVGEYFLAGRS